MKTNPFEELHSEIVGVSKLVQTLINNQKNGLEEKLYTKKEAAQILRVSEQTIANRIKSGSIKAFEDEGNKKSNKKSRILIPHSSLYNSLNEVKSLKYKR